MFRVAVVFFGALLGAGFASGQELLQFFVRFGPNGFWGIGLAMALLAMGGVLVVYVAAYYNCANYTDFVQLIFPQPMAKAVGWLLTLALWLGIVLMTCGTATLVQDEFGISTTAGFVLTLVAIALPMWSKKQVFLKINQYLIPVLVVLTMGIGLQYLSQALLCVQTIDSKVFLPNWQVAAVVYWLYNMLLATVVLVSVASYPWAKAGVVLASVGLGVVAVVICLCLNLLPASMQYSAMPMLALAQSMGQSSGFGYKLVMLLAMYTTALANCYGLVVNYSYHIKNRLHLLLLILVPVLCFIPLEFSFLVGTIYPLLGYVSIPIVLGVIITAAKTMFGGNK